MPRTMVETISNTKARIGLSPESSKTLDGSVAPIPVKSTIAKMIPTQHAATMSATPPLAAFTIASNTPAK